MSVECILCAEECEFVGVGECNHEPMCFRCIYKMRVISKNHHCPICKTQLKQVIIMELFHPFQSFSNNLLEDKNFGDIFYSSENGRKAFQKLTQYKCFVKIDGKPCKVDKKFPSIAFLKKHLKEDHSRYVCEICYERKTCVLEEQKLYNYKALNRHMERGDIDESGNVTFLHSYCKFCNKYFFDQDEFRVHVNLEHMRCNVCGDLQKFRYYKNYDGLEIHYKLTHYICSDENCLAKKFIAFRNAEELRVHRLQFHDKNGLKKIDIKQLCGFQSEGHNSNDQLIVIKDKEGVNMEDQFLNMKKCKIRALGEADQQSDTLLDIRIFFETDMDEDEHFQQAFILKHAHHNQQEKPQQKKRKYVEKKQLEKEKPMIAKQNEKFTIEEIKLIRTWGGNRMNYEDFQNKLKTLLREDEMKQFNGNRLKFNKKQISADEFNQSFLCIMRNISLKGAYQILPHFIRAIQNQDLRLELEQSFIKLIKQIPFKNTCIISKSNSYSDFFAIFVKEIQNNIEFRIKNQILKIKKPVKRCKERLFQIMGVVRRLKIEEMAKFKFATNFGLNKDTLDYLQNKVFKKNYQEIQERLNKIQTEELLDLYVFAKFCYQAIKHSKSMHLEKNKIKQNILEDYLYDRSELQKKYGPKKEEMKNLEEQIQFEQLQEEKKIKKTLKEMEKRNQRTGFQTKADFNLVDKGDFPQLLNQKKQEVKKEENFKDVALERKQKPATYQKKINQMFPTLGTGEDSSPTIKTAVNNQVKTSDDKLKTEKAWWEKINEKKPSDVEVEEDEEKVRYKKGKKKEKWVPVKGLFN